MITLPAKRGKAKKNFLWSNHKHQDKQTEQDIPKAWCNECLLLFTIEESPQSHIKVLLTLRGNPSSGAKTWQILVSSTLNIILTQKFGSPKFWQQLLSLPILSRTRCLLISCYNLAPILKFHHQPSNSRTFPNSFTGTKKRYNNATIIPPSFSFTKCPACAGTKECVWRLCQKSQGINQTWWLESLEQHHKPTDPSQRFKVKPHN